MYRYNSGKKIIKSSKIKSRQRKSRYKNKKFLKEYYKDRKEKIKLIVLQHYSKSKVPLCNCCGITGNIFLTLDHVHNRGNIHRERKFPGGFYKYLINHSFPTIPVLQVLCWNCNCAKRINNGICPHLDVTNFKPS